VDTVAVQIGAGNIGRGFIAQLFQASGFEIHFVDADQPLLDLLDAVGEYTIEIAVEPPIDDIRVSNFYTHHPRHSVVVSEVMMRADIVAISAGAVAQTSISRMLAEALTDRLRCDCPPLNFLVCENPPGAANSFRDEVRWYIESALHPVFDKRIAFVDTVVGRMVPVLSDEERAQDPLRVRVEPYCELPVDADAIVGGLPQVAHLHAESPFAFWVDRKLFMHNAAHAAAAYLGYLHGHTYVYEAIGDGRVRDVVEGVLAETAAALVRKYDHDATELKAHADDLLRRFANPALLDTVERVARDPLRKLSSHERFMRAAACCEGEGVEPKSLAVATAAAIRYDQASDSGAEKVQELLHGKGWDAVFSEVCGIAPDSPFAVLIKGSDPKNTPGKTPKT